MEVGVKLWAELNWCRTECNGGAFMNVIMQLRLLESRRTSWPADKIRRIFHMGSCTFLSNTIFSAFRCKLYFNQEYCFRP
jgi:hypothetical protein